MNKGPIYAFMNSEHGQLEKLWSLFIAESDKSPRAAEFLVEFTKHIHKHAAFEEGILFPRFDKYIGFENGDGPTTVLRRDHLVMRKLLDELRDAQLANDLVKLRKGKINIARALKAHWKRENKLQYPVLDSFITPAEWQEIVTKYAGLLIKR